MREVLRRTAHLPDALIGLIPDLGQVSQNDAPDRIPVLIWGQTVTLCMVDRVEDLAVNVELRLVYRGIANADGARPLKSGQPRDLPLGKPPLTAQTIHDLQLIGAARDR